MLCISNAGNVFCIAGLYIAGIVGSVFNFHCNNIKIFIIIIIFQSFQKLLPTTVASFFRGGGHGPPFCNGTPVSSSWLKV